MLMLCRQVAGLLGVRPPHHPAPSRARCSRSPGDRCQSLAANVKSYISLREGPREPCRLSGAPAPHRLGDTPATNHLAAWPGLAGPGRLAVPAAPLHLAGAPAPLRLARPGQAMVGRLADTPVSHRLARPGRVRPPGSRTSAAPPAWPGLAPQLAGPSQGVWLAHWHCAGRKPGQAA
jgi:hypothetical protein